MRSDCLPRPSFISSSVPTGKGTLIQSANSTQSRLLSPSTPATPLCSQRKSSASKSCYVVTEEEDEVEQLEGDLWRRSKNIWSQGSLQEQSSMKTAVNLADGNVVAGNDLAKPSRHLLMFFVRDCAGNVAHAPLQAHEALISAFRTPPLSRRQLELNHSANPPQTFQRERENV